jgi:soluble lytic murein transglycosylase-like protein
MRKICFLFVLSIVSVFSISAQTDQQPTDNTGLIENVKANSDTTQTTTESIETIDKNPETENSQVQNAQPSEVTNSTASALPMFGNRSLGEFSTGDSVIDGYIEDSSALYNVDPLLIYAQMNQESSFKRKATSHKGASGLMQLMPDTAKRFGAKNIYNPKQNIKAGVKYMRWLLDRFGGDVRLALAGYNAGEGAVRKYGNKIPPYRETRSYVARIMAHYEQITNQISTQADTKTNDKTNETVAKAL